MLISPRRD